MHDVLAHRSEENTLETAQPAGTDNHREGAVGRIDESRGGMVVDHPQVRLDRSIDTESLVDEVLDPRASRLLAIVRVEGGTGLVEEVPRMHDLETRPVGDRFECCPAERITIGVRTVDPDHHSSLF